jgi:ribonuclease P protein component
MQASKNQQKTLQTLKKRSDFMRLNQQARKWVSHGLVLQAMPNDLGVIRIGFTVTKKTEASAVKRNRIKRRLRAIAADILPLYAAPSYDYVLIGRNLTAARPYETLQQDLRWCLSKLDLEKPS